MLQKGSVLPNVEPNCILHMPLKRRQFVKTASAGVLLPLVSFVRPEPPRRPAIRPKRLKRGQTVGLVAPAGYVTRAQLYDTIDQLADMGLAVKYGQHVLGRYGYLAGKDVDRADDFNRMVTDDDVDAILAVRGGWGCNRMLEYVDFDAVRANPKIVMGYSDITSLLLALYAKSGLVSFHGPVGISSWNAFTMSHVNRILFDAEPVKMVNNYPETRTAIVPEVITHGQSTGVLVGGNLSVLTSMIGSPYLPTWEDTILFVEDVDEKIYRIDRLLTQLKIAGILPKISGFIFGDCSGCSASDSISLTMKEVLHDLIAPLGVPAWYGSMIGHISNKFTVPVGARARIDTSDCSISLIEPAVV